MSYKIGSFNLRNLGLSAMGNKNANIVVNFVSDVSSYGVFDPNAVAKTIPSANNETLNRMDIYIKKTNSRGEPYNTDQLMVVALHEIGHALGLGSHSANENDIMYYTGDNITDDMGYIRKQTLANCERFITPLLKEKEDLVLGAEEKIINLEYDLFIEIRNKIKEYIPKLQAVSKVISEIDVLQSFVNVTEKYHYVRPILTKDHNIEIINSRHPVVEKVIKDEYVPNDIIMDKKTNILLIYID